MRDSKKPNLSRTQGSPASGSTVPKGDLHLVSGSDTERNDPRERQELGRNDAALVNLVIEDPASGLAALYDRFAVDVNRLVWRLLGPDSDREDIVQQVFLQMIQSIGTLRTPDRLHFWVRSVTVNIVRSELRKRTVRRAFLRVQAVEEPQGDLTMDLESNEFIRRSVDLLKRLPNKERIVFLLYYLEELTLPEIADICGFSSMTAKRRLAAARTRFRNLARREATFQQFFEGQGEWS